MRTIAEPLIYEPAVFWPCRQHPRAGTVLVFTYTILDENAPHPGNVIGVENCDPLCLECGEPVLVDYPFA